MDTRRALRLTNGLVGVRPVVVLAARALGPGRLRLEMIKLVHELNERQSDVPAFQEQSVGGIEYTGRRTRFFKNKIGETRLNDFDRQLEFSLRRKLDPIVAEPVPLRRVRRSGRNRSPEPDPTRGRH